MINKDLKRYEYHISEIKNNSIYTSIVRLNREINLYVKKDKVYVFTKKEMKDFINSHNHNEVLEYIKQKENE